jgi:hypothetical protein
MIISFKFGVLDSILANREVKWVAKIKIQEIIVSDDELIPTGNPSPFGCS